MGTHKSIPCGSIKNIVFYLVSGKGHMAHKSSAETQDDRSAHPSIVTTLPALSRTEGVGNSRWQGALAPEPAPTSLPSCPSAPARKRPGVPLKKQPLTAIPLLPSLLYGWVIRPSLLSSSVHSTLLTERPLRNTKGILSLP